MIAALDLVVLCALVLAALHGAMRGALRQLLQLGAAVVGWLAARHLSAPVAVGLERWAPGFLARPGAAALLFFGVFAAVSLLGGLALGGTAAHGLVRSPGDRGLGAVLGGAKGALMAWVLLSALALAGGVLGGRLAVDLSRSEYGSLAREHNLLQRVDPAKARLLERALRAAREAQRLGGRGVEGEAARVLLADPRVQALPGAGGSIDPGEASRLLDDPRLRELVAKIRDRAGP